MIRPAAASPTLECSNGRISRSAQLLDSPAVVDGRRARMSPEGMAEGGFGVIPHALRYLRNAQPRRCQKIGGQLHPPAGQITHGRFTHDGHEALREARTRLVELAREDVHAPRTRRLCVHEQQCMTDHGVVQRPHPVAFLRRCGGQPVPQRPYEQQVDQPRHHDAAAQRPLMSFQADGRQGHRQPVRGAVGKRQGGLVEVRDLQQRGKRTSKQLSAWPLQLKFARCDSCGTVAILSAFECACFAAG